MKIQSKLNTKLLVNVFPWVSLILVVAVFGVVFLGERLAATNWLGVALIALGAVLVAQRL